jgi:hypothetical protein
MGPARLATTMAFCALASGCGSNTSEGQSSEATSAQTSALGEGHHRDRDPRHLAQAVLDVLDRRDCE